MCGGCSSGSCLIGFRLALCPPVWWNVEFHRVEFRFRIPASDSTSVTLNLEDDAMSVPGKESETFFFCNLKLTLYESGPDIAYVNIHFAGSEAHRWLWSQPNFWRICRLPLRCRRIRALFAACFTLVSCLSYFSILKMEAICFSETSVTFSGLHNIIS
jgi:hypothetical protein